MITIYQTKDRKITKVGRRCWKCKRWLSNALLENVKEKDEKKIQIKCICGEMNSF